MQNKNALCAVLFGVYIYNISLYIVFLFLKNYIYYKKIFLILNKYLILYERKSYFSK